MPTVGVDGTELFYEEHGGGSPVLLVHGTGVDGRVWGDVVPPLAEDHRVITYDRRGYGRSGSEHGGDLHRHAEDAAALLEALDARPATVVGWSTGGIVAADLAVHHPELAQALLLVEPPLHCRRRPGLRQARAVLTAQRLARRGREADAAETFMRWALRYRTGGTAYDRLEPEQRKAVRGHGRTVMTELDAGTGENLTRADLASIRCPTTCLVGQLSDSTFARAARRLVRANPGIQVRQIAGAGHGVHLDEPAQFVDAVRSGAA